MVATLPAVVRGQLQDKMRADRDRHLAEAADSLPMLREEAKARQGGEGRFGSSRNLHEPENPKGSAREIAAKQAGPQLLAEPEKDAGRWEAYQPYPRIAPGEYRAICTRTRTYWDRRFQRNVALLQFDVLNQLASSVIAKLPLFLNLGGDKARIRPGRCSHYWQVWASANGGPPRRGDRMTPAIFKKRAALVEVADTTRKVRVDFSQGKPVYKQVQTDEPYSTIKRLIHWESESASPQVYTSTQAWDNRHQEKGLEGDLVRKNGA